MSDPAFIALACTLGPVAYVAASILAAVVMTKVSPIKNQGDMACVGFPALVWPLLAAFVAIAGLCIGLGKLAFYLTGNKGEGT